MVTDVERDLAEVEEALGTATTGETGGGAGEAATRLAHLHVRRASLTGRPEDLDRALEVVEAAIARAGPWPDLCLLHADLLIRVHELGRASRALLEAGSGPGSEQSGPARALRADLELQLGRVDRAEELALSLVDQERTWDHLARVAHLTACRGDLDRADGLYAAAEDEITAKSMRAFAWVRLERARLALLTGEVGRARAHVGAAARAYTGHWRLHEVRGEVSAAEGRLDGAVAEHEQVLRMTGRPEAHQVLAVLYREAGDDEQAHVHETAALAAFRASAQRGEARYVHHLVEVEALRPPESGGPEEALRWARRDVELRPHHLTRGALAWTLSRVGREEEARAEMARALAYGLRDPRLLRRAAEVFGSPDELTWPVPVGASAT